MEVLQLYIWEGLATYWCIHFALHAHAVAHGVLLMMRHVAHLEGIDALALLTIRGDARDLPMINAQIDLPINGRSHEFSRETCEMSELVSNGWHLMTTFLLYRQAMQGVDSSFFFYIHSGHERGNPSYTAHTHTQHALTYGEYQMHQHMEHNKANQDPIHPLWQFSLGQFHRKENGHNWKDRDQLEL